MATPITGMKYYAARNPATAITSDASNNSTLPASMTFPFVTPLAIRQVNVHLAMTAMVIPACGRLRIPDHAFWRSMS